MINEIDCPLCQKERWIGVPDRRIYTEAKAAEFLRNKVMPFIRTVSIPCPECQPDGIFAKNKKGDMVIKHWPLQTYMDSIAHQPDLIRLVNTYLYCWFRMNRPNMLAETFNSGRYGLDIAQVDHSLTDSYLVMSEADKRKAGNVVKSAIHEIKTEWNQGSERAAELERTSKQLRHLPDDDEVPF